jgi:uncharacterized protein YjbJ (UPF0337 family)
LKCAHGFSTEAPGDSLTNLGNVERRIVRTDGAARIQARVLNKRRTDRPSREQGFLGWSRANAGIDLPTQLTTKERSMSDKETGPRAGLEGVVEDVKGKVKEVAGRVSGNEEREREGQAQQDKAAAQRDVARKEAQAEQARAEAKAHELEERSHQR